MDLINQLNGITQPTTDNSINDAANRSKIIKDFMICKSDYNSFKYNEIGVVKGQKVYVHYVDNLFAYISDGRYNGFVSAKVFDLNHGSEVVTQAVEAHVEMSNNLTETASLPRPEDFLIHGKIEPTHGQPTHGEPTHGEPTHGQPTHGEPTHGEPTHDQPTHVESTLGQPTHGEPTLGQPTHGQDEPNLERSFDSLQVTPSKSKPKKQITQFLKRAINQISSNNDEENEDIALAELSKEQIHRLPVSQRSNTNAGFVVVTQIDEKFYRYHSSSVTKHGIVHVACYDCKAKLQLKLDTKFLTTYLSGKKKRFLARI